MNRQASEDAMPELAVCSEARGTLGKGARDTEATVSLQPIKRTISSLRCLFQSIQG